jgi:hypothetical protein
MVGALYVIAVVTEISIYLISKSDALGKAAAMVTTFISGVSVVGSTLAPWL